MAKMTVKQLIAKLQKQDPDAVVVWRAHDQSEDEFDGYVSRVCEAPSSMTEIENRFCNTKNKFLILAP